MDVDLIASKDGYASTRWQRINIAMDKTFTANMVIKKVFNNDWTTTPPRMTIGGVLSNSTRSGNITMKVTLDGGQDPTSASLYFAAGVEDAIYSMDRPYPFQFTYLSTLIHNGPTFFYFIAYDKNNNGVVRSIPVTINNRASSGSPLTMTSSAHLVAYTYGDDMQFNQIDPGDPHSLLLQQAFMNLDLWKISAQAKGAEPNSACFVYLYWDYDEFQNAFSILDEVIDRARKYAEPGAIRFGEEHKNDNVLHVLASGANYNVAYTVATCILMECQWIHSNPIHSGEFFHGPFEVVDKEVPFLVLLGVGRERVMDVRAVKFLEEYGRRVTVLDGKEFGIDVLGKHVCEYLSPLVFTGVISRYSHRLADSRKHSVDVRRYMWHVNY